MGFLTTRRVWLLVNLAVTVALVPALVTGNAPAPSGAVAVVAGRSIETVPVVATAAGNGDVVVLGPSDIAAEATTKSAPPASRPASAPAARPPARPPVTTPPQTAPPRATPTTAARPTPTTAPRPTPITAPRPTPTTAPRPTPTTAAPAPVGAARSESGKASWYDHRPGVCAHKTLPFGTVVTVTDVADGAHVTCTVGDRGPFVDGRVIDLNPREFERLAPRSTGVLAVRLTW